MYPNDTLAKIQQGIWSRLFTAVLYIMAESYQKNSSVKDWEYYVAVKRMRNIYSTYYFGMTPWYIVKVKKKRWRKSSITIICYHLSEKKERDKYCHLKKRCTTWELWIKFYLGQNEDYSLRGSISDSSERLLQSSSRGKSIYKVLVKGKFNTMKHSFYKRFFVSHEGLMSPWRDLVLF